MTNKSWRWSKRVSGVSVCMWLSNKCLSFIQAEDGVLEHSVRPCLYFCSFPPIDQVPQDKDEKRERNEEEKHSTWRGYDSTANDPMTMNLCFFFWWS